MASRCREGCARCCRTPACITRCLENEKVQFVLGWIKQNSLLVSTLVAVIFGYAIGAIVREYHPNDRTLMFIGFPGELFLRLLKMLVLPLIISSLVTGCTALDPKANGRMALMTLGYFFVTSLISAIIGVALVLSIHPGHPDIKEAIGHGTEDRKVSMIDTFLDLIRNALPDNVVEACIKQVESTYNPVTRSKFRPAMTTLAPTISLLNDSTLVNTTMMQVENATMMSLSPSEELVSVVWKHSLVGREQMNVLGLIVFFMTFGIVLSNMKEKAVLLVEYFVVLDKIIMRLVKGAIWFTPFGVASLICERMAGLTNLAHIVEHMGLYIVTVIIGLFLHQFVLLPLMYFVLTRKNPFRFWWNVLQAFLTGFATESSAAALPVTIQCMEEKNNCDTRIVRFILPVGTTINMNGTAMFVAIASIYIAQMNAVEPTAIEIFGIIFTATAVSIASSATPSASLFLMIMTLSVLPQVPVGDVSLLFAIDWFLGRCRTTNNILGDCYAIAVIQHFYGEELDQHRSELYQDRRDHTVPGIGLMYD